MAHNPTPQRILTGFAGLALALATHHATAQTLGDIDVRSAPGEVLDATIALGAAAGAPVGAECIFLSRGSPGEGTFVTRANVAVYEDAGARFIRLKSVDRVADARARLRVVVQCPGQPHVAYREYRALFAPAPALAPVSPPVAATAPATGAASFPVRPGDSLESLARLLFPRQRESQRAFIDAMRERNPSLAGLGARDPIPADAAIALPDLRALPRVRETQPSPTLAAAAPPPRAAPPVRSEPPPRTEPAPRAERPPRKAAERPAPPPKPAPAPKAEAVARPAAGPAPTRLAPETDRFTLRLSGSQVDLTRSRNIDDATRAKLRERLLVLDNDDQVAALLQLRDSMKRLEGRVAELQLKLSGMPAVMPPARPEPKVALPVPAPVPKVEPPPPRVEAAPPKVEPAPPKVEAAPPKVEPAPPKVEPPPPKVEPAPKVEPPKAETPPEVAPAPAPLRPAVKAEPKPQPARKPATDWGFALSDALWVAAALLVLVALAFAWYLARRRRSGDAEEALPEIPTSVPMPPSTQPRAEPAAREVDFDVAPVAAPSAAARRVMSSDAGLATEVRGGDPAALRRRYIEQRFPEIASGVIVLSDPDSVVKAARLFYEDRALPRAVELLQFATEEKPNEQKPWLALFEIFRLERLQGQFADLAQRFRDKHGHDANWRKVQFFGREVDPGNALYRDLSVGIETIKFEAGKPPAPVSYDPVAENWLNAPMDFENELLMVDLRRALMEEAKITDEDLAPNPMPALRSVEMFTVA